MIDMMNLDAENWDSDILNDVLGENPAIVKLIVFLIDCSGSEEGTALGAVNSIMEEVYMELEADKGHTQVAVVRFGENIIWNAPKPVSVTEIGGWKRLHANSFTNLGEALKQLAERLNQKDWCVAGKNGIQGRFILFSDGMATDHYEDGMELLKKNAVFLDGKRLAVNLKQSQYSDESVLSDFSGSKENVLNIRSNEILKAARVILEIIN